MKILLATFWSVPHVGGVWRYMEQLKGKLEALGHEVDFMGPNDDAKIMYVVNENRTVSTEELLAPVKQYVTPHSSQQVYIHPLIEYMEMKRYSYELGAAYLGLEKYDLIHTQDVISTACISRVKPEGTAHVATLHGSVAHEMLKHIDDVYPSHPYSEKARAYFRQLEYIGANTAAVTITANQWLKNILMTEFGVPEYQIRVMHYGYDINGFLLSAQGDPGVAAPPDKKVILYAGRLVDLKGVHVLISALAELKKTRSDWVCWIAGSGEVEGNLKAQAANLGLHGDIVFLGDRSDIPKLMAKADLYVQPSLIENQPLSVVEAQISGLPVIVNNAGGLPEMVQHQVTGMIYSNSNIYELSGCLNTLLASDAFRQALGTNARSWAMEHWPLDKGAQNVIGVYYEALSKNGTMDYLNKITRMQTRSYFESAAGQTSLEPFGAGYGSIFSVPGPFPPVMASKGTWDLIKNSLPAGYTIPNPSLYSI